MQTSLQGIANKARNDKEYRFRNLYTMLNEENLLDCWGYMNKKASAGVDRITAQEYEKNLEGNIRNLVERLKRKQYHAKLVRRTYIPKSDGGERPLGIPALEDKLLQVAVARILKAIYEEEFLETSYGYRDNKGAIEAIREMTKELQWGKYSYIVEADIKKFFDTINHDKLIKMLERRISDRPFIQLIVKWLKAGILEIDGEVQKPERGTPQGGVISPILANIYLHYALDLWFEKEVGHQSNGEVYICRYADDFVCAFRFREDARRFYKILPKRLSKFGLELSKEKTNIISFSRFRKEENTSFEFLGFEFRWGISRKGKDIIKRRTSRKRLENSLMEMKEWCRESRNLRLRRLVEELNTKLRGYYNYYGIIGNYESIKIYYEQVMELLYKWLNRRSQKHSFNYKEFSEVVKRYKVELPRIVEKRVSQLQMSFT